MKYSDSCFGGMYCDALQSFICNGYAMLCAPCPNVVAIAKQRKARNYLALCDAMGCTMKNALGLIS